MSAGRILLAVCVASVGWLNTANAETSRFGVLMPCIHCVHSEPTLLASSRQPSTGPVNLFTAQQAGQLQIRYQPRNERSAHVQIRNLTNQALTVRLPSVFAARPVLAQQHPFFNMQASSNNSSRSQQSVAGPFGNNSNNNSGGGGNNNVFGSGIFHVAPEGLVQFDVQSVCLEQGLPTPTPGSRYEMVAIEEVLSEPATITEVLTQLRDKQISPKVAQAAAWHASELSGYPSWQKLAEIKGELTTIGRHPYFAPNELKQARALLERIETIRTTPVESLAKAKKL
ncbi:MAG: hypothetical protein JNM18_05895 [Planctomycetaceae bacterium]|nr:hypothetical protein [Planctomycetaceae bacterium]